jgi:hypothetical protein
LRHKTTCQILDDGCSGWGTASTSDGHAETLGDLGYRDAIQHLQHGLVSLLDHVTGALPNPTVSYSPSQL